MSEQEHPNQPVKRYGALTIHGMGEQTIFQDLEKITANLYKALKEDGYDPYLEINQGDQLTRGINEHSWRDMPVVLSWQNKTTAERIELHFREIHWADLDYPYSFGRLLSLINWGLGMPGVKLYDQSREERAWNRMQLDMPEARDLGAKHWGVRLQLFLIALVFAFVLLSAAPLRWLLARLSIRIPLLDNINRIFHDYIGDIQLYQDGNERLDNTIEAVCEKPRYAIRRRMIRALVHMAQQVGPGGKDADELALDGYFILAHSLGSIVAYNALMEAGETLPFYLTQQEWDQLPAQFKTTTNYSPQNVRPTRPPWLKTGQAIDRAALLKGFKGLLTIGCPIDKFTTLWPAIILTNQNTAEMPPNIHWINIFDSQDIIAGEIDLLPETGGTVGGLHLHNLEWTDQRFLFVSHTSYWKFPNRVDNFLYGRISTQSRRLVHGVIDWIEADGTLQHLNDHFNLSHRFPKLVAYFILSLTLLVVFIVSLLLATASIWFLLSLVNEIFRIIEQGSVGPSTFSWASLSQFLNAAWWRVLLAGIFAVIGFSAARFVQESAPQ